MEMCQGNLAGDSNPAPNSRFDFLKLNVKLVDTLRAVISHPFSMTLWGEETSSSRVRRETFLEA